MKFKFFKQMILQIYVIIFILLSVINLIKFCVYKYGSWYSADNLIDIVIPALFWPYELYKFCKKNENNKWKNVFVNNKTFRKKFPISDFNSLRNKWKQPQHSNPICMRTPYFYFSLFFFRKYLFILTCLIFNFFNYYFY